MKKIVKRVVVYKGFVVKIYRDYDNFMNDEFKFSWEIIASSEVAKRRMRRIFNNKKTPYLKIVEFILDEDIHTSFSSAKKQVDELFKFSINSIPLEGY